MFAKKMFLVVLLALISNLGLAQVTTYYKVSQEIFHNPERGFFTWTLLTEQPDFSHVRNAGNTITRPYIRLDDYRDKPLPQTLLDQISAGFEKARTAGIKVIVRFAYNWGPYPDSEPDASLSQIKAHLQQVAPILAANEDTILSMEAGFIGAWGEWHTSTNGLDTNTSAKKDILNSILAALPRSKFVALRYPYDQWTLNGPPITSTEAFTGTNRARVGTHMDCFLASTDDWGTWGRLGLHSIYEDKQYVASNSLYSIVGGETCNPNPPRSECSTALSELTKFHFTYLNADYHPDVLNRWKAQGCYPTINKRLGYRINMKKAVYPTKARAGGAYRLQVDISNTGFAPPVNSRPVYVVFASGTNVYTMLQSKEDVRRWAAGKSRSLVYNLTLPGAMTPGTYNIYLWLPDSSLRLSSNPAYSIRFANVNTWDATKGYNKIASGIQITQ
jgi:hypothetical protein